MAAPGTHKSAVVRFGVYEADLRAGELRRNGLKVRLQGQPFQVLEALLEHPGEIVTREELRARLWSTDTFVDFDHGLNAAIKRLRDALQDSAEDPRFVETLARRGYRFVAPVTSASTSQNGVTSEQTNSTTPSGPITVPGGGKFGASSRQRTYIAVGAVVVVVVAVALSWTWQKWRAGMPTQQASRQIKSLAVLPMENLSGDSSQEYFADGMTDELITQLASIASLRVISRTSTAHYKGTGKTIPEIARELNVDAVIEGSVGRSANKVRIRAQLIRAAPEEHLWAESYEGELPDVLALQRDVAKAIAQQIKIKLTPEEREHLANSRTINPSAYDAYLLGTYHATKRNPVAIDKAIEYFQQAIQIDPSYARAYAGLASAYLEREIWGGLGIGNAADLVRSNTLKALELEEDLAEAHYLLGRIHFEYDWNWERTEAEYKRAIELNANLPVAYDHYAFFLQAMGRQQEALAAVHRAVELDPLSTWYICDEGRILYRARRYEDAIARYQRALELDPSNIPALSRMADAYEQIGKYNEALAYAQKLQRAAGNSEVGLQKSARIYASMGKRHEAEEVLRTIEKNGARGGSNDLALAVIYSALGDRDRAIAALERGMQAHSFLPLVFVDPQLDPLRSDPRFQQLLRRAGLPS